MSYHSSEDRFQISGLSEWERGLWGGDKVPCSMHCKMKGRVRRPCSYQNGAADAGLLAVRQAQSRSVQPPPKTPRSLARASAAAGAQQGSSLGFFVCT